MLYLLPRERDERSLAGQRECGGDFGSPEAAGLEKKKLARFFLRLSRKRRMPALPNASDPLPVRAINAGFPPRVPLPRDIRKGKLYATRSESPCRPIRVTTYGRPRND
jgi:hypothetical protein